MALFFAFIGGLLLNVMPCVLPVLSLKVFRFLKQSEVSHKNVVLENLFFTLGILGTFLIMAGAVVFLKTAGQEIG